MGRQHQEMDRPRIKQVPEGSGEQGKKEKTGCKIICGAPMRLEAGGRSERESWSRVLCVLVFDVMCCVWKK